MVAISKASLVSGVCTAALIMLAPTSSQAQDGLTGPLASIEQEGQNDDGPIVVTGTRIYAADVEAAYPITSLSDDFIERSGETNLTDILAELPALTGSTTSIRTAGANAFPGAVGVNLLNLRNLGEQRTLVLVNGRRHVSSIAGSAAVDINTIPLALVEQIDVLTGGVSAIYGADGVSGVVNFILKRDFEGIDARAQNGVSSRGDAEDYYAALTAGHNFAGGAGNIAASYEYRRGARVRADQRRTGHPEGFFVFRQNPADFPLDDPSVPDRIPFNNLRFFNTSPIGAVDTNLDFFPDFTGAGVPYDPGLLLPAAGGLAQGGDGTPIAGFSGDLRPGTETHNLNVLASYEFNPALRIFAEGKFVSSKARTEGQPLFDSGSIVYARNPFLPPAIRDAIIPGQLDATLGAMFGTPPGFFPDGVLVFRDHFDFGRRGQRAERETWRGVFGFDGALHDRMSYEIAYTYGETTNRFTDTNYRITDRYFAALDAVSDGAGNIVCLSDVMPQSPLFDANYGGPPVTFTPGPDSGCVPINILGRNVASDAALAFFMTDLNNRVKLKQHVVSGHVSGDLGESVALPGGPVRFAVGGEYRKESSDFTPDQLLQEGLILDRTPVRPERGSFDVWEAYAELQLPLPRDVPGAKLLQLGAALRLSDYSTIGSTTAWKVDAIYAPIEDVRFRGTWSESVRAPNITEMFAAQSGTTARIVDPCDVTRIAEGSEFRAANCTALLTDLGIDPATYNPLGDPRANVSVPGLLSGNSDLAEETARTWSAGLVLTPRFAPRLTASIDWYDIELKGAINTPSAQEVVELCVDQPTLSNPFCANVSRNPATGFVSGFRVAPANVSRFRTAGADFTIGYAFEPAADWGTFNLRLIGGYLDKLGFVATPGATETNEARQPYAPKWTGTFDLTWTIDNVTANYGVSYFSKTRRFTDAQLAANPDIVDPRYIHIKERWEHDLQIAFRAYEDRVTFYGGVDNLFDRKPALGELHYPVSFRGRFLYFGIRANFGTS